MMLRAAVEVPLRFALAGRPRRPSPHEWQVPDRSFSSVTCSSLMLQRFALLPGAVLTEGAGNPQEEPLSPDRHRSSGLARFPFSGGEPLAYSQSPRRAVRGKWGGARGEFLQVLVNRFQGAQNGKKARSLREKRGKDPKELVRRQVTERNSVR